MSKKQTNVLRSYAEVEYWAMENACLELTWLCYILQDLKVPISMATPLYCDNQVTLRIEANHVFHKGTKHIDIDCPIVWKKLQARMISPSHVSSHCQLAYIFTKHLGKYQFVTLQNKLGVHDIYSPI